MFVYEPLLNIVQRKRGNYIVLNLCLAVAQNHKYWVLDVMHLFTHLSENTPQYHYTIIHLYLWCYTIARTGLKCASCYSKQINKNKTKLSSSSTSTLTKFSEVRDCVCRVNILCMLSLLFTHFDVIHLNSFQITSEFILISFDFFSYTELLFSSLLISKHKKQGSTCNSPYLLFF